MCGRISRDQILEGYYNNWTDKLKNNYIHKQPKHGLLCYMTYIEQWLTLKESLISCRRPPVVVKFVHLIACINIRVSFQLHLHYAFFAAASITTMSATACSFGMKSVHQKYGILPYRLLLQSDPESSLHEWWHAPSTLILSVSPGLNFNQMVKWFFFFWERALPRWHGAADPR